MRRPHRSTVQPTVVRLMYSQVYIKVQVTFSQEQLDTCVPCGRDPGIPSLFLERLTNLSTLHLVPITLNILVINILMAGCINQNKFVNTYTCQMLLYLQSAQMFGLTDHDYFIYLTAPPAYMPMHGASYLQLLAPSPGEGKYYWQEHTRLMALK